MTERQSIKNISQRGLDIPDVLEITDPDVVPILFHEKKQEILRFLIEKELTIIDIKNLTNENPGTIKRHITDLTDKHLAYQSREEINEYGIKMKYYRATAKSFHINIKWNP